jgi:hypothetical protein
MKKVISIALLVITLVSCKKEKFSNIVEEVTINSTVISKPLPGVTNYTTVPYSQNLVITARMGALKSVEWVDITIEDPSQVGAAKAVFKDKWARQRIDYTNGVVNTSFPGGLSFLPAGRAYIFHILFTNTSSSNLLQIDATITR